jgi:hypothetical protein
MERLPIKEGFTAPLFNVSKTKQKELCYKHIFKTYKDG